MGTHCYDSSQDVHSRCPEHWNHPSLSHDVGINYTTSFPSTATQGGAHLGCWGRATMPTPCPLASLPRPVSHPRYLHRSQALALYQGRYHLQRNTSRSTIFTTGSDMAYSDLPPRYVLVAAGATTRCLTGMHNSSEFSIDNGKASTLHRTFYPCYIPNVRCLTNDQLTPTFQVLSSFPYCFVLSLAVKDYLTCRVVAAGTQNEPHGRPVCTNHDSCHLHVSCSTH
ncbi:hypothetical protein B0O80DRAFT_471153 [Mortierella sp. GBAus27b]|nr:hypothetical protein B0O80DRAFT_471153 [Mortierella sp. GBAus27b]